MSGRTFADQTERAVRYLLAALTVDPAGHPARRRRRGAGIPVALAT